MEAEFFQLGGSYKPLSQNSRYWGKTGWVDGKPVVSLADDASYGTLVEELYHVEQLRKLRLEYFEKFGKMPSGGTLEAIIDSRGLVSIWEAEAKAFLESLGFVRVTIGG